MHCRNTIWPLFPLTGHPLGLTCLFNSFYAFPVQAGALSQVRNACCEEAPLVLFDFSSAVYGGLMSGTLSGKVVHAVTVL
jgi:hypothetical protein